MALKQLRSLVPHRGLQRLSIGWGNTIPCLRLSPGGGGGGGGEGGREGEKEGEKEGGREGEREREREKEERFNAKSNHNVRI